MVFVKKHFIWGGGGGGGGGGGCIKLTENPDLDKYPHSGCGI